MKKRWGVLVAFVAIAVIAFLIGERPLINFLMDQDRVRAWNLGLLTEPYWH